MTETNLKLKLGNYRITSDGICITLFQKKISLKTKKPVEIIIGHYPRLSQALDRLLEEKISESQAKDVSDLRADIYEFYRETQEVVSVIVQKSK